MPAINLPESDQKLLEECLVETMRSGGKGGQHVNKTESGVRLTHSPSGVSVYCQDDRSQYRNKQICLRRLRQKIEKLNYRPKPRKATRKPARAKRKNRVEKQRQSEKKKLRSRPEL